MKPHPRTIPLLLKPKPGGAGLIGIEYGEGAT